MEITATLLLATSGGIAVFSFSRPASSARVLFLSLFLGMTTLMVMAPSLNQAVTQMVGIQALSDPL